MAHVLSHVRMALPLWLCCRVSCCVRVRRYTDGVLGLWIRCSYCSCFVWISLWMVHLGRPSPERLRGSSCVQAIDDAMHRTPVVVNNPLIEPRCLMLLSLCVVGHCARHLWSPIWYSSIASWVGPFAAGSFTYDVSPQLYMYTNVYIHVS